MWYPPLILRSLPFSNGTPTNAVFFKITSIEHATIDTMDGLRSLDTYVAATMGELGCKIDPKVTRIVQQGVEHTRIPDISEYLGLSAHNYAYTERQDGCTDILL